MARPSGQVAAWLACLVLATGLARDTPTAPPMPTLRWVGTSNAADDPAYRQFLQALARQPLPRRQVQLHYLPVRDQGAQAAQADLLLQTAPTHAVWVAPTADAAQAVRQVFPQQPLVFASYQDPVRMGLVPPPPAPADTATRQPAHAAADSARGPVTGLVLSDELDAKRLELLRDAFPAARVVGVLVDASWAELRDLQARLVQPGQALGLRVHVFRADEPAEVDAVFASAAAQAMQAWYVPATYIAYRAEDAIRQHLVRLQRPAIHATAGEVARGALMAYALDSSFSYDMLAELATRVAAGEDPRQIPVQRPLRFLLAVRPLAAPAALRIHPSVVRRADRIH